MENIGLCIGTGHSNPATAIIETVKTAMVKTVTATMVTTLTASPMMHVPISYVLERRKPEPHGFIGNWNRIRISGCLQSRNSITWTI
jgi:hypothetical protein